MKSHRDKKTSFFLSGLASAQKILKFSITHINGTFAFAPPLNPPPYAKPKEPFIRIIIKIMFHIISVRFILTNAL